MYAQKMRAGSGLAPVNASETEFLFGIKRLQIAFLFLIPSY